MNTVQYKAEQKDDFLSIKSTHKPLYDQVFKIVIEKEMAKTSDQKKEWSDKIHELSDQINDLLQSLINFASQVTSINDYNWIREACYKWGVLGDYIDLKLPLFDTVEAGEKSKKLGEKILSLLPEELPEISSTTKISKEYLEKEAYRLGEFRKERLIIENRSQIHQLIPSSLDEIKLDYYNACTYFSSKILEGKLDPTYQVPPELYECLEEVWLEEVKHLKAYENWQKEGANRIYEESTTVNYYFQACQQITASLVAPYIKAPLSRFKEAKKYLKDNYLTEEGKLDEDKSNKLIEIKSYRIWETTKNWNHSENWLSAQQYVEDFYENIIPAVVDSNPESITKVKNAIQAIKDPAHYHIINCFEVALVIYFLPSEVLQDVEKL